ncbi:hypothetical protein [Pseudoclavibacter terrae]|uniref:hypothetical protein n=1 Tax=Pseudoclavibacter terrae TaxID=1530195 RepID=UPI0023312716|nr:hypothetical protein [Pseudoclavibacter terrae]
MTWTAAAIVYAAGFRMSGAAPSSEGSAVLTTYTGLVILALAIVALPALMRFVTPMVGALASSGGGASIANAVADRVPEGARPRPSTAPQGSTASRGVTGAPRGGAPTPGARATPPRSPSTPGSPAPSRGPAKTSASPGAASGAGAAAGAGKVAGGPYAAAALTAVQPVKKAIQYGTDAAITVAERTTGEEPSGGR